MLLQIFLLKTTFKTTNKKAKSFKISKIKSEQSKFKAMFLFVYFKNL